jgi:hypothetical protein
MLTRLTQDLHGPSRTLLRIPLSSLPYKVRSYLKSNPTQKHFSVQDSDLFFAPGALYPILPLWVEEPDDAAPECEEVFDGLDAYATDAGDGKVLGKVSHSMTGKNDVVFTVEGLVVREKGRAPGREEL